MGFFTHEAARMIGGRTQYINDTFESVIEDESIEPCSEDLIEAGFDGIIAMNENYNSIMRRMAYAEASALEETGKEFIYTEGVLGDLYNSIKSFLMKIWERIKSLFKKFIMILDSYSKDDKAFAKKYQKEIFSKSGDTSDFTFKGYKWNIENSNFEVAMAGCAVISANAFINKNFADIQDRDVENINRDDIAKQRYSSSKEYEKDVDKHSDHFEAIRALIFSNFKGDGSSSKPSSLTSEEFRKEVHELFRGGESEKEELEGKDIDVHDMYNKLITSNQDRKTAKKAYDECKKSIDQDIKALDRLQNENAKNGPGKPLDASGNEIPEGTEPSDEDKKRGYEANSVRSKNLGWFSKMSHVTKECLLTINSELLNAMKERSRQYKACLIAYVHHRPSNESAMQESYLIGKEKNIGGSIFSGISFV